MANEHTDITDIPGVDTLPTTDPDSASELDKLLLEATEGKGENLGTDAPPEDKKDVSEEKKDVPEEPSPEKKAEPLADKKADPVVEPDDLDKVELPTNVKPKTGEAFSEVKRVAREKISFLATRTKELETKVSELEAKTKDGGMTPELKAELTELRGFRAKLDVEADPAFKSFDAKAAEASETIYAKLIAGGATATVVEKIKEMGGINAIDWEPILEKLPPHARRFIESKLVEVEDIGERKAKAIAEAKANADKYLSDRQQQSSKQKELETEKALKYGEDLLAKTEWMKPRQAPSGATPEQKAAVESYNVFLKDAATAVSEAAQDGSPEMRAALGLGVAELMKVRRDFSEYRTSSDAQIKQLEGNLKEAQSLLEKIKKGSTQRLRNTSANTDTLSGQASKLTESGAEAIDRLAREAQGVQ